MWVQEEEAKSFECSKRKGNCAGKSCMAWRWGYFFRADPNTPPAQLRTAEQVGVAPHKYPADTRFLPRRGYCGLAGKPER